MFHFGKQIFVTSFDSGNNICLHTNFVFVNICLHTNFVFVESLRNELLELRFKGLLHHRGDDVGTTTATSLRLGLRFVIHGHGQLRLQLLRFEI